MRLAVLLIAAAFFAAACDDPPRRGTLENVAANAAPAAPALPRLTGRVVDDANLLAPEQEQRLGAALAALESRTTDQLVIVTIPDLAGQPIEDYARRLGNHWGLGQAGKDNGVLIVVAPVERKVRIAVGDGLEPVLTNARADEIIRGDMLPAFRESRWYDGIDAGARSIAATLVAHAGERRGRS